MPYRRLPNTNNARLKAIKIALETASNKAFHDIALSVDLREEARQLLPQFERATIEQQEATVIQGRNSKVYNELTLSARQYVSHFYQAFLNGVTRGELNSEEKRFFKSSPESEELPTFTTDADLLYWGQIIIDGDMNRTNSGGRPIYFPSIGPVNLKYKSFAEQYHKQKALQNNSNRLTHIVAELKVKVDALILRMWNEIEEKFTDLPDQMRRDSCSEYGVVYIYRPLERKRMEADKLQYKLDL